MKKKIFGVVLAAIMSVTMITGCGSSEPEQAATLDTPPEIALNANVGGLAELQPITQDELTAEDESRLSRAMRAYTPSENTLLKNNAKSFYYYSQLDTELQTIYDTIMLVAEDPMNDNNVQMFICNDDLQSDEFGIKFYTAQTAAMCDHPELFWLYNETESKMAVGCRSDGSNPEQKYVYMKEKPQNFEDMMNKFNSAADAFLADIDTTKSEAEIAKAIHDKLIEMVTYDHECADSEDRAISYNNLAHTAYGCLVANSFGTANYAVCDGYSQAYEYLLQQAGMEAAVVRGNAGGDESKVGGHAWSIIKIDGTWTEVDSTWDDGYQDTVAAIDEAIAQNPGQGYESLREAVEDPAYSDRMQHYLYRVSTPTIRNYTGSEEDVYKTKDGNKPINLIGTSVHIRDSEFYADSTGFWEMVEVNLSKLLPEGK